tara:strand:+ start:2151 stop:2369 length:219 start_codon:yes stop_codon:yes gene_type:complete
MGKMKELYIAIQEGYMEDLRKAYLAAYKNDQDTVFWQGKQISLTYAKYLLDFDSTFHDSLRKMIPNDKTDNE